MIRSPRSFLANTFNESALAMTVMTPRSDAKFVHDLLPQFALFTDSAEQVDLPVDEL